MTEAPQLDRRHSPQPTPSVQKRLYQFFSGFETVYGDREDEKPANGIREIGSQSTNLNEGFDGKFVWIVPQFSLSNGKRARQSVIWCVRRGNNSEFPYTNGGHTDDLSGGDGGLHRYLFWGHTLITPGFRNAGIVDVALWRTDTVQLRPPTGFRVLSANLNEDRGGDFLYLVYS
ncbi:MAG: hypothetical protein LQ351_002765 [Letrouitia transgressa]|nr:MAG: hypothetical protein LQ351_002765 [Letrouitia transgressa]